MRDSTDSASRYLDNFLEHIVNGIPKLLGALVVLLIGYFVAKAISAAIRKLLQTAKLNQHVHAGKGGNIIQRAVPDPTNLLATIVYWVVFLFAISIAVSVLGIPVLVDFVRAVYGYLPNIFAAILIFLVAGAISAGVATLVTTAMGDTPTGKVIAAAAPVLVMVIAVFMILNQLKIAPAIVTITYAALLGSTALGMALAFGLGGREVAGRMLQDLYDKGQDQKGRVVADFKHGSNEAKQRGKDLRGKM
ncbi:MAG TPA: hypothetical protein VF575_03860 [Candidatus Saccharimonadales bacterium]|jgi:hypothetical protein